MTHQDTMSAAEYRALVQVEKGAKRRHKYGAKVAYRCEPCGAAMERDHGRCLACGRSEPIRFDSTLEAHRYDHLRVQQGMGLISGLDRQVRYPIVIEGRTVGTWIADFVYFDERGEKVVEDTKGFETPLSKHKRRAVEAQYGIEIRIVR